MADAEQPDEGPPACPACRGTGSVLRKVGEEMQSVTCPWCEGGGVVLADHDAQDAGAAARAAASS